MQKRLIAVLLSILMLLMLLPAAAAEEDATEQPEPIGTAEPVSDPEPEPAGEPTARGTNDVQVNITDFDADFWEVLKDIGAASEVNGVCYIDLDTKEINCGYKNLTSLKGIEQFTNLERLNCQDNELTNSLSAELSHNTALKELVCHSNHNLTTLDLSANTALETLEVLNCSNLTTLDISQNANLKKLVVDATPLSLKDANNHWIYESHTNLAELSVAYKGETELDVSMLPNLNWLNCSYNELNSLNISALGSLKYLFAAGNHFPELNLANGVALDDADLGQTIAGFSAIDNGDGTSSFDLDALGIQDFTRVTLTGNTVWTNAGSSHAVTFPTGENATYTYDIGDQGTHQYVMPVTVDFGGGSQGGQNDLQVNKSDFDSDFWNVLVDIGAAYEDNGDAFIRLDTENIFCDGRGLGSIEGVNRFVNLKRLNCERNQITNIDLSGLHLEELNVNDNQLTIQALEDSGWDKTTIKTLEVAGMDFADISYLSGFTAIETLNCSRSALTALDVSGWTTLTKLDCQFNSDLSSLKINAELTDLEMGGTSLNPGNVDFNGAQLTVVKLDGIGFDLDILKTFDLTTLDVDGYAWETFDFTPWPNLHDLRCDGSSLKSLTVAGLSGLYTLRANDNELTSLDLSGLASLKELFVNGNALTELRLPNGVTLDEAELDQTVRGCSVTDNGDGTYSFDLGTLVTDLDRVTLQNGANWADPNNRGVVTWQSMPTDFRYTYDIGDPNFTMPVHVFFDVKISVSQADFAPDFWDWLRNNGIIADDNGTYSISGSVTEINCSYAGLASLKGIEFFTNLEALYCEGNELTSLDLSRLDALKKLYANDNHLAELLLSQSAPLEEGDIDRQNRSVYDVIPVAADQYTFDLSKMVTHPDRVTELTAADAEEKPISVSLIDGVLHFGGLPSTFGYGYETGIVQDDGTPVLYEVVFTDVGVGPAFKSKTMTLEGMIGVNFYMDLSSFSDEDKEDSYMEFTINGRTQRDDYDPDCLNPNGDRYYGFTCYITSIEMADLITATFCYRNGRTQETQFTAQEYLKAAKTQYTGVTKEAVESVADYGHYVQEYLMEVNGTDGGHDTIDAATEITAENMEAAQTATEGNAIQREPVAGSYITRTPFSLSVNDTVTINLYVEVEAGHELLSAMLTRPGQVDPEEMEIKLRPDGLYRVRIEGIKASELADSFIITLNAGGADMPVTVSALSYVQAVLSNPEHGKDSAARKAVTAIYQYYVKTKAYVDAQNQQNP